MQSVIITGATDDRAWSDLRRYAHENHTAFARRNGMVAVCGVMFSDGRPPSWAKLRVMKAIPATNAIIWMDADCIFAPDATAEMFTPQPEAVRTMFDQNGINCGVLVFPEGQWVSSFLQSWWDAATPDEINHRWWEQKTLHRMAETPRWRSRIGKPLDQKAVIHAAGIPLARKMEWLKSRAGAK